MPTDPVTAKWVRSAADEAAVSMGCVFDERAADRVRRFFATFLRHSKGAFASAPFELQPWQWEQVVAPLYGWRRPDGTRRYRRASVWVPKKNGKSTLAAGLILYGLVADGEPGAEVYGAAADRNQAAIIFNEVAAMVAQSPGLAGKLTVNASVRRAIFPSTHSFYQVLSKDSRKTGHGVNAHVCVIDELHVVDRELYDTLRYAGAARRQPLLIEISTAGNDKTSLGYERYQYAKRLVRGEQEDWETLAVVYEAEPERWEEPAEWRRSNPSLGVTVTEDSFRSDFQEAKNGSPATQGSFKQLRLNLWQDTSFAWLPLDVWDACAGPVDLDELAGLPCWGGLDLASKMDLTAWVLVWQLPGGRYAVKPTLFAPEAADSKRQGQNLARLAPWIRSGHVIATPGDTTDYDHIERRVIEDCERFAVREVAYDPWNASHVANHLQAQGVQLIEFGQTIKNYNEPMKELERLVISNRIIHDGNPAVRWMVGHLVAKKDPSGNVRPDREKSADHIDAVTGLLMALGRAVLSPAAEVGGVEVW